MADKYEQLDQKLLYWWNVLEWLHDEIFFRLADNPYTAHCRVYQQALHTSRQCLKLKNTVTQADMRKWEQLLTEVKTSVIFRRMDLTQVNDAMRKAEALYYRPPQGVDPWDCYNAAIDSWLVEG